MIDRKICGKCKREKQVGEFYKRKDSKDGYQTYCKMCIKIYTKSEQRRQTNKRYNHSEKGVQARGRYRLTPKKKRSDKRYAQTQKFKQAQRRYLQSEKGRQATKKRDAIRFTRKTQAGGSYTVSEWYVLCKYYKFCCLRCGKQCDFEELTLDHIKPVSKGGTSFIWNLQPLCDRCNKKKGNKEIDYRQTLPDWIGRDGPIWIQNTLF